MTDADASIPGCQFDIGFRYRCIGDGRHDAKARCHLSEQGGLVALASIDGDSHPWDGVSCFASAPWWSDAAEKDEGAGGRVRRPLFVLVRCRSRPQSSQPGVASTYAVFDMPTICSGA